MSENYRLYATKMAELQRHRARVRPLMNQLDELLGVVLTCEASWAEGEAHSRPEQDE